MTPVVSATVRTAPYFYDIDPMNVVWHGNYPRFLELGRVALLDKIGYGYKEMIASGYAWPVTDMTFRYVQPLRLGVPFDITATLVEWENRLKIHYEFRDAETGRRLTRASTVQVAVSLEMESMCWETPAVLRECLAPFLSSPEQPLMGEPVRAACVDPYTIKAEHGVFNFRQTRNLKQVGRPLVSQGLATVAPGKVICQVIKPVNIVTTITPASVTKSIDGGPTQSVAGSSNVDPVMRNFGLLQVVSGDLAGLRMTYDITAAPKSLNGEWTLSLKPRKRSWPASSPGSTSPAVSGQRWWTCSSPMATA